MRIARGCCRRVDKICPPLAKMLYYYRNFYKQMREGRSKPEACGDITKTMVKYTKLPAISGRKLIRILKRDGWTEQGRTRHVIALKKSFGDHTRVTVIPNSKASLDEGTLSAILGPK
ncbi:MAG: type II toxin-antitoxin system HicA family toxin [Dehalococcoidia bacterium]|nr:type II toxin-antitoxin system HicA family toxin [Dehalococcoidia bacterium]